MISTLQRYRAVRLAWLISPVLASLVNVAQAHEGGVGNEAMWNACEARNIDDRCAFQNVDHDVFRGTCQSMSNALVCVRNQPIERAAATLHTDEPERPTAATGVARRGWSWIAVCFVLLTVGLTVLNIRGRFESK